MVANTFRPCWPPGCDLVMGSLLSSLFFSYHFSKSPFMNNRWRPSGLWYTGRHFTPRWPMVFPLAFPSMTVVRIWFCLFPSCYYPFLLEISPLFLSPPRKISSPFVLSSFLILGLHARRPSPNRLRGPSPFGVRSCGDLERLENPLSDSPPHIPPMATLTFSFLSVGTLAPSFFRLPPIKS